MPRPTVNSTDKSMETLEGRSDCNRDRSCGELKRRENKTNIRDGDGKTVTLTELYSRGQEME